MISVSFLVNEESAIEASVTFTDEDGTVHAPGAMNSARFQLSDIDGNIINDRSFENGLFSSNPIVLYGDDLALSDTGPCRRLAIKVVYSSTSGTDLPGTEEELFKITDLVNI